MERHGFWKLDGCEAMRDNGGKVLVNQVPEGVLAERGIRRIVRSNWPLMAFNGAAWALPGTFRRRQDVRLTRKAFTLIELLAVIAIIALLLPTLSRAKSPSKSAHCQSNLHQLGIALASYLNDNEIYPTMLKGNRSGRGWPFSPADGWFHRLICKQSSCCAPHPR